MNDKNPLRIALAKGALLKPTLQLLETCGYDTAQLKESGRRLYFSGDSVEFIICRASDIPTYVMYGAADVGFVGKDILMEEPYDVFELLDLGYGRCKFVLAGLEDEEKAIDETSKRLGQLRVATKFPNVTKDYFEKEGRQVEIIKLYGSIELAPIVGLSDLIVDLASTGKTLAENRLKVIDEISTISCRLIANYVSNKLKSKAIEDMVTKIEETLPTFRT